MASANPPEVIQCEPCLYNTVTVPAVVWCLSCEDGLCHTCADSHKGIKATRGHKVIPVEKCQTMFSLKHLIPQQCTEHNKILDHYCHTHDVLGCRLCILKEHRVCEDITSLDDISKNVVSSASLASLEEEIRNLLSNLMEIKQNCDANKSKLENQKSSIQLKIKDVRRKLNNRLDELESGLLKEMEFSHGNCKSKVNIMIDGVEKQLKVVTDIEAQLVKLKEIATDKQLFLAIREIQKIVTTHRNELKEMLLEKYAKEFSMAWDTGPLEKIFKMISFGSIMVTDSPCKTTLVDSKERGAQLSTGHALPDIDINKLSLVKRVHIKNIDVLCSDAFGAAICSNGNLMLFACGHQTSLKVFNKIGKLLKSISVPGVPCDMTLLEQNRIAITYGYGCRFEIAEILNYNYRTIKSIRTVNVCSGISRYGENMAVYIYQDGINIYDLKGNHLIKVLNSECNESFKCILMFKNQIYFNEEMTNIIRCFDLEDKEEWRYLLPDKQTSTGITIDQNGNLFVACSYNIYVISKSNRKVTTILSQGCPRNIDFDMVSRRLLVREAGECAALYDVIVTNISSDKMLTL